MKTKSLVLSGKTNFLTILYLLRTVHGILPEVIEITIKYKQQLGNNTILSRALFRNVHSNVRRRFMGQPFQDPPLCGSTLLTILPLSLVKRLKVLVIVKLGNQ
jgi:hypothetical protein